MLEEIQVINESVSIDIDEWNWYGVPSLYQRNELIFSTYSRYPYSILPPVKILDQVKEIKTLADVESNLEMLNQLVHSPTSCCFEVGEPAVFYRDQQDCILWEVEQSSGRVFVRHNPDDVKENAPRCYMAHSLPEFISRVKIEGEIWYKLCSRPTHPSPLTEDEQLYFDLLQQSYAEYHNIYYVRRRIT